MAFHSHIDSILYGAAASGVTAFNARMGHCSAIEELRGAAPLLAPLQGYVVLGNATHTSIHNISALRRSRLPRHVLSLPFGGTMLRGNTRGSVVVAGPSGAVLLHSTLVCDALPGDHAEGGRNYYFVLVIAFGVAFHYGRKKWDEWGKQRRIEFTEEVKRKEERAMASMESMLGRAPGRSTCTPLLSARCSRMNALRSHEPSA